MNDDTQVATPEAEAPEFVEEQAVEASHADDAAGHARLVVKRNGAATDIEFPVSSPAVIGRFDPAVGPVDVDLGNLPEGSYVSRKHAKITAEDGGWMIHDLGSSNGTFVLQEGDFARVEMAEIKDGDEIALGNARFTFHVAS